MRPRSSFERRSECRSRFYRQPWWRGTSTWSDGESAEPNCLNPLVQLFRRFAASRGKRILVGTDKPFVASAFQIAAMNANVTLRIFKDMAGVNQALDTAKKKT